jgi:hypothetical protein
MTINYDTKITTIEEFDSQIDKELVQYTGNLLQKQFAGYLWGVRSLAPGLVGFTLAELMDYGDNHIMVVHPRDCPTKRAFDKIVKKLGGELLERARLSREKSKNLPVTQRPDGFNPKFDKTIKLSKIVLK